MKLEPQQPGYPCSPHCEGYLRELALRDALEKLIAEWEGCARFADPDQAWMQRDHARRLRSLI